MGERGSLKRLRDGEESGSELSVAIRERKEPGASNSQQLHTEEASNAALAVVCYSRMMVAKIFSAQVVMNAYAELDAHDAPPSDSTNENDDITEYCLLVMSQHVTKMLEMHPFYSNYFRRVLSGNSTRSSFLDASMKRRIRFTLSKITDAALELESTLRDANKSYTEFINYNAEVPDFRAKCLAAIEDTTTQNQNRNVDEEKKALIKNIAHQVKWGKEVFRRLFSVLPVHAVNSPNMQTTLKLMTKRNYLYE